jgi:hypothetical protein
MTAALSALLGELLAAGVVLKVERRKLKYVAPRGVMTDAVRRRILDVRDELLATMGHCPRCVLPLDDGRCWHCHWRACSECGRDTTSAFLQLCLLCDVKGIS